MNTAARGNSISETVQTQTARRLDRLDDEARLARARKVLAEAVGIDSHIDTIQRVLVMEENLGERHDQGCVDLPRLREGGMRAPFFAFWVPDIRRLS